LYRATEEEDGKANYLFLKGECDSVIKEIVKECGWED
jgi:hypothetical protein